MASRSRKSRGGGANGLLKQAFAVVVIGACIVGFFGIPARPDVADFPDLLKAKSETVESWMKNCVPKAITGDFSMCSLKSNTGGGGNGTPAPPVVVDKGTAAQASATLGSLKIAPAEKVKYDRGEWNHWISSGSGCWDVREQVLYDEAVKDATLVLKDKSGKEVTDVKKACSITAGTWNDPYSGTVIKNPKELDIDHMIPLSYAAQHGGQAWDSKKKESYANNLSYVNHLIAVKASENRSKSDKGPSEWKPSNKGDYCNYAVDWITISKNFGLSTTQADANALKEMLATC